MVDPLNITGGLVDVKELQYIICPNSNVQALENTKLQKCFA